MRRILWSMLRHYVRPRLWRAVRRRVELADFLGQLGYRAGEALEECEEWRVLWCPLWCIMRRYMWRALWQYLRRSLRRIEHEVACG